MNKIRLCHSRKSFRFLFFLILPVFLISCGNFSSIYGKWEDEERILEFDNYGDFCLEFKNSRLVKGFRGKTLRKKNAVVLFFEEFENSEGEWLYTDGTDLENYKEVLLLSFENGKLVTEIKATGKKIVYSKVSSN